MSSILDIQQMLGGISDNRLAGILSKVMGKILPNGGNTAVTAYAGGGQTNATALNQNLSFHNVTTVATAADSIKLPPAKVGEFHVVKNSASVVMQVFGNGTDTIDSVAYATGVSQLPGDAVIYFCIEAGNYLRHGGVQANEVFSAIVANSLTSGAATLPINGLAAAQGGSVTVTGGTSSTSGNTGGAVSLVGGTGGATGNGGAASLIGGSAGAAGLGGNVAVTAGTTTSGNGANVTLTASNGAGGTNSGGNINIVTGAAVSTGVPGEVKINSDANLIVASYYFTGTPAATDQVFFVAPRACRVQSIRQVHSVAAGGVSTLTVTKDTGTNAPGAGTVLHSGSFNLNATANTVQSATVSTTVATITLAAGDRLAVKFANAIQSSAGIVVTVGLSPA